MNRRDQSLRGLTLAAGILLIAILASSKGALEFVNGAVYDRLSILELDPKPAQAPSVVIIELNELDYHQDEALWRSLGATLAEAKPKQIVLLYPPTRLSDDAIEYLATVVDMVGHESEQTLALPLQNIAHPLLRAQSDNGVYRRISLNSGAPARHSLLRQAATSHRQLPVTLEEVYPNFIAGTAKPPRIAARRLIDGEIPPSLLHNTTAVLAPATGVGNVPLYTPGGASGANDFAGFFAHALQSVINDHFLLIFPQVSTLTLIIVLSIGCLVFYQRAGLRASVYFTAVSLMLSLLVMTILLHGFYVLFPIAQCWLIIIGMWIAVLNNRYVLDQQGMLLEINQIRRLMQQRLIPEDVLHSDTYWQKMAFIVQQLLQLNRSIFLEAVPGERKVVEIQAVNCSINEIDERRRDYERSPYTTALKARAPVPVSAYLQESLETEQQYLAPFVVEGRVLGFWAFTMAESERDTDARLRAVTRLAEEISQLLDQRQQLQLGSQQQRRRWFDYLLLQGGRSLSTDLNRALTVTTKRLETMEELFRSTQNAVLLFDTFGQLLLVNPSAENLCQQRAIEPYGGSYSDILSQLTGLPLDSIKDHLQHVLIRHERVTLALQKNDDQSGSGTVNLYQIGNDDPDRNSTVSGGVAIEITEADSASSSTIPKWIDQHLQNSQLRDYLARCREAGLRDVRPAQPAALLAELLGTMKKTIASKGLVLATNVPDDAVVLVPTVKLHPVLNGLLCLALQDAKRGSAVAIDLLVTDKCATFSVTTDGIGIPQTRLEKLREHWPITEQDSQNMFDPQALCSFGVALSLDSTVGEGSRVNLTLPLAEALGS